MYAYYNICYVHTHMHMHLHPPAMSVDPCLSPGPSVISLARAVHYDKWESSPYPIPPFR